MNGVDRTKARRLARLGQASAAVLAAGAVLAFMVEPSLPAAPEPVAIGTTESGPERSKPERPTIDVAFLGDSLNQAARVDPKFPDAEPVVEPADPEPKPTASTPNSNYRFLGGFFSPSRSLAIISGGGKQQMVRVGDEFGFGFKVTSITPDTVEFERNGQTERLDRVKSTGAVVGTTMSAASTDSVAPGTVVSESARDRLRRAREEAGQRMPNERVNLRADYERQRQQRIEELRQQGIEVDESDWRRDD